MDYIELSNSSKKTNFVIPLPYLWLSQFNIFKAIFGNKWASMSTVLESSIQ